MCDGGTARAPQADCHSTNLLTGDINAPIEGLAFHLIYRLKRFGPSPRW